VRALFAGIGYILCASCTSAALCADDVISLGAAVSLTGKYALNGVNTRNGYDFAVRRINDKGGVKIAGKAFRLEVRYYDDQSKPARGIELVERLIRKDGVRFVLGPYSSVLTKAVIPVVERHRVPMVQANGAAQELFAESNRYMFVVLSTADQYLAPAVALAARYAERFGKKPQELDVALVIENEPVTQDVRTGVLAAVQANGINFVLDDRLPSDLDDMSTTLRKVRALEPDIFLVSGRERGALTAIKQIEAMGGVDVPLIALTHCDSAALHEKQPEASEHVLCTHQWHRSLGHKDDLFGSAEDFARAFEDAFGYDPPYQAAQSAAAVQVFADALERAQSMDPDRVRDAISAADLKTFYGPIKFDASGKNVAKPMVLTQIVGGEYVVVWPEEWAVAEPVIPRPRR
jgi:branched-chain amino acid transport system substrate-binding protein